MFSAKGLASLKIGRRQTRERVDESRSSHSISNKKAGSPSALHVMFENQRTAGEEKVSYLCDEIMFLKTFSSAPPPLHRKLLPPPYSSLYGTSSAGLTTEEVAWFTLTLQNTRCFYRKAQMAASPAR